MSLIALHAQAADLGIGHEVLHDLAVLAWGVGSMNELDHDAVDLLLDAVDGLTPRFVDALRRLAIEDPAAVAPSIKPPTDRARRIAALAFKRAEQSWPERRASWTPFWNEAHAHGVGNKVAFEATTGRPLPGTPDLARAALHGWIEEQIAADEPPDDVDPGTDEIVEADMPLFVETPATKGRRRIAGVDD